jgi:hypothetical protein
MAIPINNVTRRVVYAASGTGPYAFTFEILAATDIAVYRDDTLLTLTTDYTVTINANGTGSVTLTATPTGATQIAIVGNRTIQRLSDFVTGGDFFANTLNDELDQQTIFAQQNAEGLGRAMQAPQTDPTSINMTLPRASDRANKTLNFDANGNPVAGLAVVANATAGVATWLATPSSANLAAAVTDETGTGALVFATNPTLSGATVAGNITITGTGRRITGDFSNATLASRVIFQTTTSNDGTSVGAMPNGTAINQTNFAVFNTNDPANASVGILGINPTDVRISADKVGTGTYLPLTFYTGGSERVRVDTSGNVGIGTSSPGAKLQVVGIVASTGSGTSIFAAGEVGTYTLTGITSPNYGIAYGVLTGQTNPALTVSGFDAIAFGTNQAERMRLNSSGNLGIGTASPGYSATNRKVLALNGGSGAGEGAILAFMQGGTNKGYLFSAQNTIELWSESGEVVIGNNAAAAVKLLTNNTERMRIDGSGNLGIGTSSPGAKLDVVGSGVFKVDGSGSTTPLILRNNNTVSTQLVKLGFDSNGAIKASINAAVYGDDYMTFNVGSDTERMRLDSSGNLGIGTTTSSGKLTVTTSSGQGGHFSTSGGSGFPVVASVNFASSTAIAGVRVVKYDNNTTTSQVFVQFAVNQDSSNCGQINANGANTAAFGTYSDARLKERVIDLPSQLANILALRPVEFDYIQSEGGGHQIGFIAQEMEQIYPDVVGERADGMKTITAWSKTEARLVKAIQEQQAIIERLTQRIAALESKGA